MSQIALFDDVVSRRATPVVVSAEPWKAYGPVRLYLGDCVEVLRLMTANSVDAGVTDPPYGIGFMGKEWDTFSPESVRTAAAMKQRKDPADLAELTNVYGRKRSPAQSPSQVEYDRSLGGQHGFQAWCERWAREVYRVLKPGAHLLVCGAPRSAHRMVCGVEDAGFEIRDGLAWLFGQGFPKSHNLDDEFDGWGTALKPGHEPICLARKPLDGDTVDENMQRWGVGALNVDLSRLAGVGDGGNTGRWPPNVALDEQAAARLDEQAGVRASSANPSKRASRKFRTVFGSFNGTEVCAPARGAERGGASRFFFVAKPSRLERDFGCDDLPVLTPGECTEREAGSLGITPYAGAGRSGGGRNFHPTVKPVALMRWLLGLVTPPGGVVLDPFLGSGTTGMAAVVDGYQFIGIDQEARYLSLGDARISAVVAEIVGAHPPGGA